MDVTANLGYVPCMAAPVSHQSAESLTEILKSLSAGAPHHGASQAHAAAYVTATVVVMDGDHRERGAEDCFHFN